MGDNVEKPWDLGIALFSDKFILGNETRYCTVDITTVGGVTHSMWRVQGVTSVPI
jgi:hypothetical protein